MRVLHLNTNDVRGGAALAAHRLHTGLRQLGVDSAMLVSHRVSNDPTVKLFTPPMDLPSRLRRRLRREWLARSLARYQTSRPSGYEPFRDSRTTHGIDLVNQLPRCDLVNLHWIAEFVDYESFFATVPGRLPVVWTMHDMNPFTGGCHYDDGCGKYMGGCGACPQLGSRNVGDLSREIWQRKQRVFSAIPEGMLHIVAPSAWIAELVRLSPLLGRFPLTVIPNGLDLDSFAPRCSRVARDVLGIPQRAKVMLFVAGSLENRRKGFAILDEALGGMEQLGDLLLVSLGGGKPAVSATVPHLHLGHIDSARLLSLVYSAADIFLIPSLQDNLPNTVMESLACGTPVVGFAVSGIPEMVRPGVTGVLVPPGDVGALRDAVATLLHDQAKLGNMGANCRKIAVEEYGLETQARNYAVLYEKSLSMSVQSI